jgi:hypothetical protein
VAIKAFALEWTGDQAAAFAERLESLVDLGLTHPSVVAPIAAGLEGDTPYLVEEYVFGESLDVALRRYGPAPAADAARLVAQLAAALDAASLVGILHGGLHPRDVLVTPDLVRLTGLGIVGALERTGIPPPSRRSYSAPERNEGDAWDNRADVFSLAGVAAELLTGRAFADPGRKAVLDFEGILVAKPDELTQVFSRGLAPGPRHRYATAGAFAAALELALTGRSSRAARAGGASREVAAARPGESIRARRAKRRQEGVQPTLASIADEVVPAASVTAGSSEGAQTEPASPSGPDVAHLGTELARIDELRVGRAAPDVIPIGIADPPPAPPDVADTLPLNAPGPELATGGLDLADLSPIEPRSIDAAPAASMADLPLGSPPAREEPAAGQPGALPFEEREPAPQVPEPVIPRETGGLADKDEPDERSAREIETPGSFEWKEVAEEPPLEKHVDEIITAREPRSVALPVALALAAGLVLGTYGGYQIGIRNGAQPAGPATASARPAAPTQAPAATDIYLPPTPEPTGTGITAGPAASRPAVVKAAPRIPAKTTKAPAAPKATVSSAAAAKPPAGTAAPGSLAVESRPAGARVFVDGRVSGTTPLVLPRVAAGSHVVRVERDGYRRWSSKVLVASGRRAHLTASLDPESPR